MEKIFGYRADLSTLEVASRTFEGSKLPDGWHDSPAIPQAEIDEYKAEIPEQGTGGDTSALEVENAELKAEAEKLNADLKVASDLIDKLEAEKTAIEAKVVAAEAKVAEAEKAIEETAKAKTTKGK